MAFYSSTSTVRTGLTNAALSAVAFPHWVTTSGYTPPRDLLALLCTSFHINKRLQEWLHKLGQATVMHRPHPLLRQEARLMELIDQAQARR